VVGSGEWDRFSKAADEAVREAGRRRHRHGELPSGRIALQVLMQEMSGMFDILRTGRTREVLRTAAVGLGAAAIGAVMALCEPEEPQSRGEDEGEPQRRRGAEKPGNHEGRTRR